MKRIHIFYLSLLLITINYLLITGSVLAIENFRTDYTVDYFLSENDNNISSRVSYKIKITNLPSDLVIKNFSILFPK